MPRTSTARRATLDACNQERAVETIGRGRIFPAGAKTMHVTYDQWMRGTALGAMSRRSAAMRKVDKALKAYDKNRSPDGLRELKASFEAWKRTKPGGWRQSDRNKKGMVSQLDAMLRGPAPQDVPLAHLVREQQRQVNTLFQFRKLETRVSVKAAIKNGAMTAWRLGKIANGADQLGAAGDRGVLRARLISAMDALLREMFGTADMATIGREVSEFLGMSFLPDLMKSMMPYAGMLTSGANALLEWKHTVQRAWRRHTVRKHAYAARPGDPAAAVEAISRILWRELHEHAIKASINTADFSVRGIVAASGGSPVGDAVVGGLSAIAKLTQTVYIVGRDFREKSAANNILTRGQQIDHKIFGVHPLLGCYYVVCVPTSNVINILLADMGEDGWVQEVDRMAKAFDPIKARARQIINDARFVIPNMPNIAMAKPPKDVKVPKGRIRGIGNPHLKRAKK